MFKVKIILLAMLIYFFSSNDSNAAELSLGRSKDYRRIPVKVTKKLAITAGYHEGLYRDGNSMWVANGKKGKIYRIDLASGEHTANIEPMSGFTEGITNISGNQFFVTDWDDKKIYRAKLEGNKMVVEAEKSVAPAFPTGVVWTGSRLFAITWTRGLGTKYHLLEMDEGMNILRRISIQRIEEPSQLAWDGKYLWISSWYNRVVYRIDTEKMEMNGFLHSPVIKTTGIVWDEKGLWLTGTYSDLYRLEMIESPGAAWAEEDKGVVMIKVTSDAFVEGGMIPKKYSGEGEDMSPPLEWSGIPAGTKSIAIIADDPDAPAGLWTHWVLFNLPADVAGLPEGVPADGKLSDGAVQGITTARTVGYHGPYPPSGTHRYYFKIYALDAMLDLDSKANVKDLERAMKGHIIGEGKLMGRYKR